MNPSNNIGDEEFVPFLINLGVETYKKSFEWMLNDSEFSGVLLWLYDNLNESNALTAREEYRFAELQRKDCIQSPDELEVSLSTILSEYEGIPLPGDQDAKEDVEMETQMYKERLISLEKQEAMIQDLIRQNKITKDELDCELAGLNAAHAQFKEDEKTVSEECLTLVRDNETITEGVVHLVSERLAMYANCLNDKEISKKFVSLGPLESYCQSLSLFMSHFDLYSSKRFGQKQHHDSIQDKELQKTLADAKNLEISLSRAIDSYFSAASVFMSTKAAITFLSSYVDIQHGDYQIELIETQSKLNVLEQEISTLDQEICAEIQNFVEKRTKLAVDNALRSALLVREKIYRDLTVLYDLTRTAYGLECCVYFLLRHELNAALEMLHFAAELSRCVEENAVGVKSRIESMNAICTEQEVCRQRIQSQDSLLHIICSLFGVQTHNNTLGILKLDADVRNDIQELKEKIQEEFKRREDSLEAFKISQQPLKAYLWDGCTKQVNCQDRSVAALAHTLKRDMHITDKMVIDASQTFATVKNGDKNNLRKLWQWFLTDPSKLLCVVKEAALNSYS